MLHVPVLFKKIKDIYGENDIYLFFKQIKGSDNIYHWSRHQFIQNTQAQILIIRRHVSIYSVPGQQTQLMGPPFSIGQNRLWK